MRLLLRTEREPESHDILLATAFEALADGPKNLDEILRFAERVWPGAVVLRETLERALRAAEERGWIASVARLDASSSWELAARGTLDLEESQRWAREVLERCERQVAAEADRAGLTATPEQVAMWTRIVLAALDEGIAHTFKARPQETRVVENRLFPPYDPDRVQRAVRNRCDDPQVCGLLSRLSLVALDPQSIFGSELVHYVATGYVLYAFMSRADLREAQNTVGSLSGEAFVLDTPILLRLLGDNRVRISTLDILAKGANAGATLVMLERTTDEVKAMLRHRTAAARRLEQELADGVSRERLAATAPDEVHLTWLQAVGAPTWDQFCSAARGLAKTLKSIGAETSASPAFSDVGDTARFEHFKKAIRGATTARGTERPAAATEHDAALLLWASQQRQANPSSDKKLWPGAVVLTPDKHLTAAYADVVIDNTPIAMTLAQFAAVVARGTDAESAEALAHAVSLETSYQARMARATRVGPERAIELARAIQGSTIDEILVDAEELQLTLDEVLKESEGIDPNAAARAAVVRFEEQRVSAGRTMVAEAQLDARRARDREVALQAQFEAVERIQNQTTGAVRALTAQVSRADLVIGRQKRWLCLLSLYSLAVVALLVAWLGLEVPGVAVAAGGFAMLATLYAAAQWANDLGRPWWQLALAGTSWGAALGLGLLAEAELLDNRDSPPAEEVPDDEPSDTSPEP